MNGSGSTFGTTYSFYCDEGYEMDGQSTVFCDEQGQWNATIPVCSRGKKFSSLITTKTQNAHQEKKTSRGMAIAEQRHKGHARRDIVYSRFVSSYLMLNDLVKVTLDGSKINW